MQQYPNGGKPFARGHPQPSAREKPPSTTFPETSSIPSVYVSVTSPNVTGRLKQINL